MAKRKLKIVYFVQSLGKGGAERLILDICNELLLRKDTECLLVSFSELNHYTTLTENIKPLFCEANIRLSILKRNTVQIDSLLKIITDFKPDIIHSNVYLCELLTREKTFSEIAYFTHCHNNMPEFKPFGLKTIFSRQLLTRFYEKKRIEKKYKNCNNQFIAISKDTLNYYSKNLHRTLKKNVHYLPNAINYSRFQYTGLRHMEEQVKLIMVGHMSDYKNQIFLIDVLHKLRNKNVNAHLTLAGDWRNNGHIIEAKAKELELEPYLHMPGLVDDIENQLIAHHVYVHSAYYEPFGLVLLEAMASGLPVVCLDGGGNRDIIEEGKNGFMINGPDPELFASKIMWLCEHPEEYQKMSRYCTEYAGKYDIVPYVDNLLNLYRKQMLKEN